jgi:hypothetical protein
MSSFLVRILAAAISFGFGAGTAFAQSGFKEQADDLLSDMFVGQVNKRCYEAGERLRKAIGKQEDLAFDAFDDVLGNRHSNADAAARAEEERQQAARAWNEACRAAIRDGVERAYGPPSTYLGDRFKHSEYGGPIAEKIAKLKERVQKVKNRAEQVKQVYDTGVRANELYEHTQQFFRDVQKNRPPVYDVRAGNGRVELWLVGHEFPNGFVPLPTPKLISVLPTQGSNPARPTPPRQSSGPARSGGPSQPSAGSGGRSSTTGQPDPSAGASPCPAGQSPLVGQYGWYCGYGSQ